MSKLLYVLWKSPELPIEALRGRLLGEVAPRLLALEPRALSINLADVGASLDATVPITSREASVAALVSISFESTPELAAFEKPLRAASERLAGYLVRESIPLDYDRPSWADGERTPGAKLLTLFNRHPGLSDAAFFHEWFDVHTPLSLEIHPFWCYVRNVVEKAVTDGAPAWDGIVEEQFRTLADLTEPDRFYGSRENMKRVLAHSQKFLDLPNIQTYLMSEYILRSASSPEAT